MLILLVGPKGAGKSHVGRILSETFDVEFVHVETFWSAWREDCLKTNVEPSVEKGIEVVHPRIAAALHRSELVCVETTGASAPILEDLLSLASPEETLLVRVTASPETCASRLQARDPAGHLPLDDEVVRHVHAIAQTLDLPWDVTLENEGLSREAIAGAFREALPTAPRGTPTDRDRSANLSRGSGNSKPDGGSPHHRV